MSWRGDTTVKVGIGLIGTGWMARVHTHAIRVLAHLAPVADTTLVGIASSDPDRAELAARELGFGYGTADWHRIIDDPRVHVVAVLGANNLHAAPSIASLEAGKAVLCEKPLGRDPSETAAMLTAASKSHAAHACGFNYRFVPALRLARELVASGRLGTVRQARCCYLQDWASSADVPHSWRFQAAASGSGAVGDYAHLVDLLRYLIGEPESVVAETARFVLDRPGPGNSNRPVPVEVEDAYAAVVRLGGDVTATLEASRCATGRKGFHVIEVYGTDGALWWDMEDLNRLHVYLDHDERERLAGFRDVLVTDPDHPFMAQWWTPGHILGWDATFVHQWQAFLYAVVCGKPVGPDQASFDDGHRAAVVCDAIVRAAGSGRRVCIALAGGADGGEEHEARA